MKRDAYISASEVMAPPQDSYRMSFEGCGCSLGLAACRCVQACEQSERGVVTRVEKGMVLRSGWVAHKPAQASGRSWFWSDASVLGIACLATYGFIAGWFA